MIRLPIHSGRPPTPLSKREHRLRDRLSFEELISSLGRQFLAGGVDDFETVLRSATTNVCRTLGLERVGLLLLAEDDGDSTFHHEHAAAGCESTTVHPLAAGLSCGWLLACARRAEPVMLESLDDLPADAAEERASFAMRSVASLVQLPLASREGPFGVFYVEAVSQPRRWDLDTIDRLSLVSHLLSVAIERHRFEQELLMRADRERALSQISSRFVNCRLERIEDEIAAALAKVGLLLSADRCFYFEFSADHQTASSRFEWCAPGVPSVRHLLQNLPRETFEPILAQALRGEVFRTDTRAACEIAPPLAAMLEQIGVQSIVHVPVFVEHKLVATIGLSAVRNPQSWPHDRSSLLRLVGEMIVSALERRRSAEALEEKRDQLTTASRMAVMGEMVAGIAHEIRQPLHAIRSFAAAGVHALSSESSSQLLEVRRWNERILSLVDRSNEIIGRYRDYCRPQKSQFKECSLAEALSEAVELVQTDIRSTEVALHLPAASDLPNVIGDRIQLAQVLVNLLKNACEAVAAEIPSRRKIEVQRTDNGVSAGLVRLRIRDYGSGVSPDDLERAFDPFWTTKSHGTGLGLAVCRTIIADHEGRIWIEAESPGTTVYIELPLAAGGEHAT